MPEGIAYVGTNVIAGTGLDLNYLGDYCYAYSGTFNASTNAQTFLDFTSGAGFIRAKFNLTQYVREDSVGSTESTAAIISMNGVIVYQVMVGSSAIDSPTSQEVELIIPPYTGVTVTVRGGANAATRQATVCMIGTVHK